MNKKRILPAVFAGAAMMLAACGDDSGSSPEPMPPVSGSSIPTSSADNGGGNGGGNGGTAQTYGILPATANPTVALGWYNEWKAKYYRTYLTEATLYPVSANDWGSVFGTYVMSGKYPARVVWDTSNDDYCIIDDSNDNYKKRGCTVSEGVGYGMLLTLFAGDFDAFNSLWYYNRGYREYQGTNLMPWRTGMYSYESLGSMANASSATDADLDIATSLVLAHFMSGGDPYGFGYLNDALLVMAAIWDNEISPTYMIYSGNTPTWKTATAAYNLSYFSPVALKLFAMVDPSHDWTGVLNTMYAYMQNVQTAGGTGVFPDWSDANGAPIDPKNGSATKTYWRFHHEAVRIPWRIAWDYYWTQDPRAQQVLNGMNTFIVNKTSGNPANLTATAGGHIYSAVSTMPDSTLKSQNLQSHWHGAWCLTGMGGNQAWIDACTSSFNQNTMGSSFSYFPHILLTMYGELLNGLFVKPATLPL